MKGMAIHGVGTMAFGTDATFGGGTAMLAALPIRELVAPALSRRYGRLTKMMTIAARRALDDAGLAPTGPIPVVAGTCIGETGAALGILTQIHETDGVRVSPALVPNSVHNAAAGFLLIAAGNQAPSMTVSQGWLTSEAALVAAQDFLAMGAADQVLVVVGDEADPAWGSRLESLKAPHLAAALDAEGFQEGAVACILSSRGRPGRRLDAAVERWPVTSDGLRRFLARHDAMPSEDADIRVRQNGGGERLRPLLAEALGVAPERITLDGVGPGTVHPAPLVALARHLASGARKELLLLATEAEEMALVHFR